MTTAPNTPATPGTVLRRRDTVILGGTAALGLLLGFGISWHLLATNDLWLVNGLDLPMTVAVDGTERRLAPGARQAVRVASGTHTVVTLDGDRELAREDIDVPSWTDAVVYNVLGAAPVCEVQIRYSASPGRHDTPTPTCRGGTRFFTVDDVDHVFKEPPRSVSVKGSYDVFRRVLFVDETGWRGSLQYLLNTDRADDALTLALALADAGSDDAFWFAASTVERTQGPAAMLALLREWRAAHPRQLPALHTQQSLLTRLGFQGLADDELRRAREALPDDVALAVLAARSGSPTAHLAELEALAARYPTHPQVHFGLSSAYFRLGRYEDALPHFTALEGEEQANPEWQARALLRLGRTAGARQVLQSAVEREHAKPSPDWDPVVAYAQAWVRVGREGAEPARLLPADVREDVRLLHWLSSRVPDGFKRPEAEGPPDFAPRLAALEVNRMARRSPAEAWTALAAMDDDQLRAVSHEAAFLLALEFERAGDPGLAAALRRTHLRGTLLPAAVRAFVQDGTVATNLDWADPGEWAALHFVRGRHLAAQGADPTAEYAAAEDADDLDELVATARRTWPAPRTSRASAVLSATEP